MASEVARLREQIEAECRSLQMLKLFSTNASHEMISAKFAQLDKHYQQLVEAVGEEEATELSVSIYNSVMDEYFNPSVGPEKNATSSSIS